MIGRAEFMELLSAECGEPCVSIYMPMQRRFPEQAQNEVRLRNLLKEVQDAERRTDVPTPDDDILGRLRALLDDRELWTHPADGLAVFAAPGFFRVLRLPRPVTARVVVARRF